MCHWLQISSLSLCFLQHDRDDFPVLLATDDFQGLTNLLVCVDDLCQSESGFDLRIQLIYHP
jgi:hypothetical protein